MSTFSYRCTASFGTVRALCGSPTWIRAWPNWWARSFPSGLGSSARTLVVLVFWSTSVPTQVTLPAKAVGSSSGPPARDGEGHRLARLDLRDVSLVDVDPEPDRRGVGHGVELRRRLDGLADDGVAEDDRAVDAAS